MMINLGKDNLPSEQEASDRHDEEEVRKVRDNEIDCVALKIMQAPIIE